MLESEDLRTKRGLQDDQTQSSHLQIGGQTLCVVDLSKVTQIGVKLGMLCLSDLANKNVGCPVKFEFHGSVSQLFRET